MIRSVRAHPGVFIGGGITFLLVEHWLMHRGGVGQVKRVSGNG